MKTLTHLGFGRAREINRNPVNIATPATSGTEIFAGRYDEEYLQKLLGIDAICVFDQMRRSDGQVKMLLSVVKNPIKSAPWAIEAVDDSDEEKEIADFATHVVMRDIGTSDGKKKKRFKELLTEILTCVEFGYSTFEKVHKIVKNDPVFGDYIGYEDIGFRHQRTIEEWIMEPSGAINHIRQVVHGDLATDSLIAGEHLVTFTIDKEGDNYEGISMLRPCYGSWFRKNLYRKFQAIGIERASMGTIIGKMSEEMLQREDWEAQRLTFQTLLDQFSGHERNSIVVAPGLDTDTLKIEHDAEKVQTVINSENVEMSKAFLVTFMEMGIEGNGGSYALGTDISDIFLSGIQFIADMVSEILDRDVIEPVIKAKFGIREKYPKMRHKGINDKAGEEFAKVMKTLGEANAVQISDRVKKHVHELYNLPDFDPELAEELKNEANNNNPEPDPKPDSDIQPKNKQKPKAKDSKKLKADPKNKGKKELSENCCNKEFNAHYARISQPIIKLYDEALLSAFEDDQLDEKIYLAASKDIHLADLLPSVFIARNAEKLEAMLRASLTERSDKMISKMVNIVKKEGAKGRTAALAVTMPDGNKFKADIRGFVGEIGQKALSKVLKELGTTRDQINLDEEDYKDLPNKSKKFLNPETALFADFLDSDMEKVILFSFNDIFDETDSPAAIEQKLVTQRNKYLGTGAVRTASVNMTSKTTNSIRNDVFSAPDVLEDIESFVFTNPAPKSPICQNLAGRVFSKEEYATTPFLPPLHHNCKSFIRAQTEGKRGNKPVDPNELQIVGTQEQVEKARKSITL